MVFLALDDDRQQLTTVLEIQEILSTPCGSEDLIDNALRSYLGLTTKYKGTDIHTDTDTSQLTTTDEYLHTTLSLTQCLYKLFTSNIFATHADYVRRQIIFGLLQEDDPKTLQLIVTILLFDGRQNETTLQMMNEVGVFPRLLELLQMRTSEGDEEGNEEGLQRLLMDMLYEMSRIQRVRIEDLGMFAGWVYSY